MVKATEVRQTCTSCHHPPVKGALALSSGKVSEEPSARMQVYELSTSFYSEIMTIGSIGGDSRSV